MTEDQYTYCVIATAVMNYFWVVLRPKGYWGEGLHPPMFIAFFLAILLALFWPAFLVFAAGYYMRSRLGRLP